MGERTERVLVLYGSQTGNSEQAAKDICNQVATKLSPQAIGQYTKTEETIVVDAVHMQLDDFLELERAKWTRLVVICVSSYGVGMAPLGGYRFRELCDAWAAEKPSEPVLDGLHFALCGLGDSKFTTFFENPTKINDTLLAVGAKRAGPIGKADASGKGNDAQNLVIDRWIDGIWPHLAQVLAQKPLSSEALDEMQQKTVELCQRINPDFAPQKSQQPSLLVPLLVLLVALLVGYSIYQNQ